MKGTNNHLLSIAVVSIYIKATSSNNDYCNSMNSFRDRLRKNTTSSSLKILEEILLASKSLLETGACMCLVSKNIILSICSLIFIFQT